MRTATGGDRGSQLQRHAAAGARGAIDQPRGSPRYDRRSRANGK